MVTKYWQINNNLLKNQAYDFHLIPTHVKHITPLINFVPKLRTLHMDLTAFSSTQIPKATKP